MIYHAFLNMIMLKSFKLVVKTNINWVIVFHLVLQFYWFVSSAGDNGEVDLVGLREEVVQRGRLWGGQFSHVPNISHLPKLPKLPCVPEFAGGELGGWGWWCDEGWWDGSRGGRMWKAFLREKCCPVMTLHRSAGEEGGVEEVSTAFNTWLCCFQWCQVVELWLVNFSVRNVQLIQFISSYRPWSPTPS